METDPIDLAKMVKNILGLPGSGDCEGQEPVDPQEKETLCEITEREPMEPSVEERRRWVRTKLESAEDF